MQSVLRLINLVLIVLVVFAIQRGAGDASPNPAYAAGRWLGAILLSLAPLLTVLALRRDAGSGLRSTTIVVNGFVIALFCLGGAMAAANSDRILMPLIGATLFCLLGGLNIWALRKKSWTGSVGEYWRGELPLPLTFWVGGALLLLIQFVQMIVFGFLADELPLRAGAWMVLSMFAITALLVIWQSVSVWRSATQSRYGSPTWSTLAKGVVFAGVAMFGLLFARVLWAPIKEHALIAAGKDPLPPLEVSVTTEAKVLLLHGTFGSGSAERVRRLLDETPTIKVIALSSPGGRLHEASEIADLVRGRKLDTYVDTRCESACTFVFLAGKDRAATPNARIGFHRPSFAGVTPVSFDPATESMLKTYRDAGIPGKFLDRVAATESSHMWYPTPEELEEAGVINRVSLGGETSAIGFISVTSKNDLAAAFRNVPMMVAMDRHFPGTIDAAVKAAWMERTQGGIDSAVGNAARNVIGERYPKILAAADDQSLDVFANIMLDQMKAASAISTEACRLLLAGQLNIAQVLSPKLVQREQDWALGVLQAEQLVPRTRVDDAAFRSTLTVATSSLAPEVMEVVGSPEKFQDQPRKQCESTIALYDRVMQLPDEERHLLLRGMFQSGAL